MPNAVIGALRVNLGLDSAQFTRGLQNAQKGLGTFGRSAALGFAAVAAAATVAAGAMARAVKGSIDHADALSKNAQKAGVATEALSRLEYAGRFADVSLDTLTGSLQKLSKSMADSLLTSTSTSAIAFKALGIEVKNADGSLRSSNDVFLDVADRFSRMEDGAAKTSLAMMLFGKSGAALIPMLNEGADGLKRFADESDRTGNTISTKAGKAAEKFNDTLEKFSTTMQGVANQIMEAVLPSLQALADILSNTDPKLVAVGVGIAAIAASAGLATPAVVALTTAVKGLYAQLALIAALPGGVLALAGGFYLGSTTSVGAGEDALIKELGLTRLPTGSAFSGGWGSSGIRQPAEITVNGGTKTPFVPGAFTDPAAGAKTAADAAKAMDDQIKAMNADLASQHEEWERLQDPIRDTMDAISSGLSGAMSGLISDLIKGKDAVGGLINAFGSLGDRLIQMAMDQAIQGLLGSLFGAALGGGFNSIGNGFSSALGRGLTGPAVYGTGGGMFGIPGFDGGGYTGMGSRAGGLDGKGGFLAMLHPDETVLDHSKGQGGLTMNFNITGSRQDAAAIANLIDQKVREGYMQLQRNPDR